jgi:2-C-methyl-D-erythritol 4-phosphate cytidylyltransferase
MIENLSCLLLSGGTGSRMKADIPKQYLELDTKPIVLWSFDLLLKKAHEMIVVADPPWRELFSYADRPLLFADPGPRRQDSVANGFKASKLEWILIHDGARPFLTEKHIDDLFSAAQKTGAAALATSSEASLRIKKEGGYQWIDRNTVYQMQTPQLLHRDLLSSGFNKAALHNITVTDDVALAELLGTEIALVEGSKNNIKITTPEDLAFARFILSHYAAL